MKLVIKDIFLKYIHSIQINYLILIEIYPYTQKKKNYRGRKIYLRYRRQRKYHIQVRNLKKALNEQFSLIKKHS